MRKIQNDIAKTNKKKKKTTTYQLPFNVSPALLFVLFLIKQHLKILQSALTLKDTDQLIQSDRQTVPIQDKRVSFPSLHVSMDRRQTQWTPLDSVTLFSLGFLHKLVVCLRFECSDVRWYRLAYCLPKKLELNRSTVLKSTCFWSCDGTCPNRCPLNCMPNVAWAADQAYAIPDRDRGCWRDSQENRGARKLATMSGHAGNTPQGLWPDCSARSCPRSGSRSGEKKKKIKMILLLST